MAITDDITSIIFIVVAVLAITIVASAYVITNAKSNAEGQEQEYLQDYYNTGVDTFLHMKENTTGVPFNVLMGDYIYTGKRRVHAGTSSVDIATSTEQALDTMFGRGNYFINITPMTSDAHITFIFDGTDSLQAERQMLAQNINVFRSRVQTVLDNPAADINITIYIMSAGDEATICQDFALRSVECKKLGFEQLYRRSRAVGLEPPAVYKIPGSYAQAKPATFLQADWVAGTLYAAEEYTAGSTAASDSKLHIIIPVSNKLSTGSIADSCLSMPAADTYIFSNYNTCALCNSTCPVERSAKYLKNVTDFVNISDAIAIPVFSTRCSFKYNPFWAPNTSETPITQRYIDFPIEATICEEPKCGGCNPGPNPADLDNFCFHDNCYADARSQMLQLATGTGGDVVDISDINALSERVVHSINTSVSRRNLQIGAYNESRKRHVIERSILLPNYGKTRLRIWVYEGAS